MASYAALAGLVPCDGGSLPPSAEAVRRITFSGRILAPLRDNFGRFDGFVLEIGRGKERCFETDDCEIAGLVQLAWFERRTVSVLVEPGFLRRPLAVTLEEA
ncbi:MAG TPA: hypothetical protein VMF62_14380 [Acetobacteraceae bacterium]|nr:hypothetical protein [Acetobacteraceae bacterium]